MVTKFYQLCSFQRELILNDVTVNNKSHMPQTEACDDVN